MVGRTREGVGRGVWGVGCRDSPSDTVSRLRVFGANELHGGWQKLSFKDRSSGYTLHPDPNTLYPTPFLLGSRLDDYQLIIHADYAANGADGTLNALFEIGG